MTSHVHTGKKYEERLAEYLRDFGLASKRKGKNHYGNSCPDVLVDLPGGQRLVIEAKLRKALALETWLEQVEVHAKSVSDVPVVICKRKGDRIKHSIFCCRLTDAIELLNLIGEPEEEL